jgi:hypothetical protein
VTSLTHESASLCHFLKSKALGDAASLNLTALEPNQFCNPVSTVKRGLWHFRSFFFVAGDNLWRKNVDRSRYGKGTRECLVHAAYRDMRAWLMLAAHDEPRRIETIVAGAHS